MEALPLANCGFTDADFLTQLPVLDLLIHADRSELHDQTLIPPRHFGSVRKPPRLFGRFGQVPPGMCPSWDGFCRLCGGRASFG